MHLRKHGLGSITILLLFGACGIEQYSFLYPPYVIPTPLESSDFELKNVAENQTNPDFYGYIFFYRLYNNQIDMENDKAGIQNLASLNPSDAVARIRNTYQYSSFCKLSSDDMPLFVLSDKSSSYSIYAKFLSLGIVTNEAKISAAQPGEPIDLNIYRGIMDGVDHKSFREISLSDGDVKNNGNSTSSLYIQLFVVSFGLDISSSLPTWANLYSSPVWMGSIDLIGRGVTVTE